MDDPVEAIIKIRFCFQSSGLKPFIVEVGELGEFWVETMEAFTDVTKLVEAFGLVESVLSLLCHQ